MTEPTPFARPATTPTAAQPGASSPPIGCIWGAVIGLSTVVLVATWGLLLIVVLGSGGIVGLSLLGGHELTTLDSWRASTFAPGALHGVALVGLWFLNGMVWAYRRRKDRKSSAGWWAQMWLLWLLGSIILVGLAVLFDHLGVLETWEATGVVFAWVGWALCYPVWSVIALLWMLSLVWRSSIRRWFAGVAVVGCAVATLVVVPGATIDWFATRLEKAAEVGFDTIKQDRAYSVLEAAMVRLGQAAANPANDDGTLEEAPRFVRSSMLLLQMNAQAQPVVKTAGLDQVGAALTQFGQYTSHRSRKRRAKKQRAKRRRAEAAARVVDDTPLAQTTGYVLALSWQPQFCASTKVRGYQDQCASIQDRYVVHGLWPQLAGWRSVSCRSGPNFDTQAEKNWNPIMPSAYTAQHQWDKHGRCLGWSQERYFDVTAALWERVSTQRFGRAAGGIELLVFGATERQWMISGEHFWNGKHVRRVALRCRGVEFSEVWVCFDADFDAVDCPSRVKSNCARVSRVRAAADVRGRWGR